MRQDFSDQAIVLKVGVFREADCWVRLITPAKGLITAFAFGGCRSRRRFCGCLDPFCLVRFRITSNASGEYLALNEGTLLERFAAVRGDAGRLGMAVNCLKFVEAAGITPQGAGQCFRLLLDMLHVLAGSHPIPPVLPLLFRARLTFEHGYRPEFRRCAGCGGEARAMDDVVFIPEQGRVFCPACRPSGGTPFPLSGGASDFLRQVLDFGPEQWVLSGAWERVERGCLSALDGFVRFHMGLEWQGNGFRRV